ncbi:MAG: hypothetical protein HYR91_15425, partial [Flavobacteriia bacterium]|nr:hypothetical protein [Flavobacteriia bacterium]
MRLTTNFRKWTLVILPMLFVHFTVLSGIIHETNRIYSPYQGTAVEVLQPSAHTNLQVSPLTGAFMDHQVVNRVSLAVDHAYPQYFGSAMTVRVSLSVKRWNASLQPLADTTVKLDIYYNPFDTSQYTDRMTAQFNNAYKLDITLDSVFLNGQNVTQLPANLFVQGDIFIERYESFASPTQKIDFISSTSPLIDSDCDGKADIYRAVWNTIPGAEEYQLEWFHVNDYGLNGAVLPENELAYNFRLNSTRISTTNNYYDISLIYDQGWIVFRLRGIGVDINNPSNTVVGVWNMAESGTLDLVDAVSKFHITNNLTHQQLINWQYSATYAEDGKKKEVISYADGTLRNRQTVTRINSDQNVIVGETIYDHQGRAAINVLPVPVVDPTCSNTAESAIKFYPNFNKNENGTAGYSKEDFDKNTAGETCATTTPKMATVSGASNYYSGQNPDQTAQQAYVPDAKGYPFAQVEYTPDNTGRVRKQGGVGEEFQLGSGHETEYLYGQPNQVELDRMFGSEVGYASHYKRNVVIDAHGQASISYLDQEGRVIATALAGDAPENLSPIASESNALKTLTIDAFNTLPNGTSDQNTLTIDENGYKYSTQLTVAYQSNYHFTYDFVVAPMQDECLPNMCIDCVYDLKLEVRDECGALLTDGDLQQKVTGKFTTLTSGGYSFHGVCVNPPANSTFATTFDVILDPGYYSVNKILTINEDALQAYIDLYHDASINNCVKTLEDFQNESMASIDTSDCHLDCETCLQNLGTLESYLANGNGTADDYYAQKADCDMLCNDGPTTLCSTAYNMMMMDMSPGGQYAEHTQTGTNNFNPSNFALSILSSSHQLPNTTASWRLPQLIDTYGTHTEYQDANGNPARVQVEQINGVWVPSVLDVNQIVLDAVENISYTVPQNLANVQDFVNAFENSWAKSLVIYHPEYCYYSECIKYENKVNQTDTYSSHSFDDLMTSTQTFQEAKTNKFIKANNQLENWFIQPSSNDLRPWDPIFVNDNFYEGTTCTGFMDQFIQRYNQYELVNGVWKTMPQMAAMTVRCGFGSGQSITNACFAFGTGSNQAVLDAEWQQLKAYYRSLKQEILFDLANCKALKECSSYNGCFNNEVFNAWEAGMINSALSFVNSPWFNPNQPCGYSTYELYRYKIPRFVNTNVIPSQTPNEVAYQQYLMTGQCPNAFATQNLLNKLAQTQQLDANGLSLNLLPEFGALYLANNDYNNQTVVPLLTYHSTVSGNSITANWMNLANQSQVQLTLQKSGTPSLIWDNLIGISQLVATGSNTFTAKGIYQVSGQNQLINLSGQISFFNLNPCSFDPVCTPNAFANDLQILMNALSQTGKLTSSVPTAINPLISSGNTYSNLVSNHIENASGITTNQAWLFQSSDLTFKIINPSVSTNDGLFLKVLSTQPTTFPTSSYSQITSFDAIVPLGQNTFKIKAHYGSNQVVELKMNAIKVSGTQKIAMPLGECDLPQSYTCEGEQYDATEQLEDLLRDVLVNQSLNSINLFASNEMEPSISSSFGSAVTSTSSVYTSQIATNGKIDEKLVITAGECEIILQDQANNTYFTMDKIEDILSLSVIVNPTNNVGNSYDFQLMAVYHLNGQNVTKTILGKSCIALKDCNPCPENTVTIPDSTTIMSDRETRLQQGITYLDLSTVKYQEYKLAIDSINIDNGWDSTNVLFVNKIALSEFFLHGQEYPFDSYKDYITKYRHGLDNHQWLNSPAKYAVEYGYGTNVIKEYDRYTTAIDRYNQRAQNAGLSTMTAKTRDYFLDSKAADKNYLYVDYIEAQPSNGQSAQGIDVYLGLTTTASSSNDQLYQEYVQAYKTFLSQQELNPTCLNYQSVTPLYSYNEVDGRNLFCSQAGINLLNDYITSLNQANSCPDAMPFLPTCSNSNQMTGSTGGPIYDPAKKDCQKKYLLYRNAIQTFNTSYWAQVNNIHLDIQYTSLNSIWRSGKCDCIMAYIQYLQAYIQSTNPTIPSVTPQVFSTFTGCGGVVPSDPCEVSYDQYISCVADFNNWAQVSNYEYFYDEIYSYEEFQRLNLCNCVNELCARFDNIKNGTVSLGYIQKISEFYYYTSLVDLCQEISTPPCEPEANNIIGTEFPTVTLVNDCIEMAINQAMFDAQLNYQTYVDSLNNELIKRYKSHCLAVDENMTYTYQDKMYHFTLYYYDQAGNLIKTVPPGGTKLLPITSSTDALKMQISNDRVNDTKTVFTDHKLVTTYEYNSLNQLVAQKTPDADAMNIFELTLPNGLHAQLQTTQIQMINSNRGYLSGYIGNRGYLYKTEDAGTTWSRVNQLVGEDLKKVQFLNATLGIAIGKAGIVLRTVDGGNKWDMLPTYSIGGAGMINNLNDFAFIESPSGTFTGYIVGEKNCVVKAVITATSQTFTPMSTGIIANSLNSIRAITTDGSSFYCTVNTPIVGNNQSSFYTIGVNGTSWTAETNITTSELNDIAFYDNLKAYACGKDGRIYKNSGVSGATSSKWMVVPNTINGNVKEIEFFDELNGIALVDNQGLVNVMQTLDGAKTWTAVNNNGYTELSISEDRTLILAVGNNGLILVLPKTGGEVEVPFIAPTTNFTAGWIGRKSANEVSLILTANDGKTYYTSNAFINLPIWTNTPVSSVLAGSTVKAIESRILPNGTIKGVVQTADNKAYYISKLTNATTFTFASIGVTASDMIGGIAINESADLVVVYNNTNKLIGRVNVGANNGSSLITYTLTTQALSQITLQSIEVQKIGSVGHFIGVGSDGTLEYVKMTAQFNSIPASSTNPSNQRTRIVPIELSAMEYQSGLGVVAAGVDGQFYFRKTTGGTEWQRIATGLNQNILDLEAKGTDFIVAGSNGLLQFGTPNTTTKELPLTTTNLQTGQTVSTEYTTTTFNSVAEENGRVYAVGDNGNVLYSSNLSTTAFTSITPSNSNLYGVGFIPGMTKALIVGKDAQVYTITGTNFVKVKDVFVPKAKDVHFVDQLNGTLLAENYTLRTTNDGGQTWKAILPNIANAPINVLNRVWTYDANLRFAFGDGLQQRMNGQVANAITVTGISNVRAVTQKDNKLVVGGINTISRITISGNGNIATLTSALVSTVGASVSIRTAHVFQDGSIAIAGDNGYFALKTASGSSFITGTTGTTQRINDMYFLDNINGVLVGVNGTYLRTINQTVSATGYLSATSWQAQTGIYSQGSDPLGVGATNEVNITAVAFASATQGIFGGNYLNTYISFSNPLNCYVRQFLDASNRYSARYFYDKLGRLVVSENARQRNGSTKKYSYFLFDAIGRVVEVGEKTDPSTSLGALRFKDVFGTDVSDYYNPSVIDNVKLITWINGDGARKEVTKSYYDQTVITGLPTDFTFEAETQRKRITHVTYEEVFDGNDQTYDHATHYVYDIHGNVVSLLQDNKKMATEFPTLANQQFKRMDYRFDLVSGNVHRMSVQNGAIDQWHHAYEYDADNRITNVYTTKETPILANGASTASLKAELVSNMDWQEDAKYFYYEHGPLARVEIGDQQLQGVDYVYNLQGWLKGVNATSLDQNIDPGKDGVSTSLNAPFAKDVYGYALHYFDGDYLAINGTGQNRASSINPNSHAAQNQTSNDLFNGNIRYMQTTLTDPATQTAMPMLNSYQYDQLNRFLSSRSYESGLSNNEWNPTSYNNAYFNAFTYDAMGNILTQKRHKRDGTLIEDLSYGYKKDANGNLLRNRLYNINDWVGDNVDATDVNDMDGDINNDLFNPQNPGIEDDYNYSYDEEGRLIMDLQEGIDFIVWSVSGKVKEIVRSGQSNAKNVKFDYNATGNRIAKHVLNNQTGV